MLIKSGQRWGGRAFTVLTLSISLSACSGFKPRTEYSATQSPLIGQSVSLREKQRKSGFQAVLEKGLRDSGASLKSEAAPGVIEVKITELKEDKTVSAYSSVLQVREFNHFIELDFTASRKQAKGAAKPKRIEASVRAERTQIYDSRFVLGVSEEERIIRNELRAEVVRLLALRLAVLR